MPYSRYFVEIIEHEQENMGNHDNDNEVRNDYISYSGPSTMLEHKNRAGQKNFERKPEGCEILFCRQTVFIHRFF
ncbi:hypothetical protein GCM10007968_11030 [Sporolactobacillus putidus]|uniref:Uncharacterized protein n=1 Tax=Sporolactobacillus putidus TaxID=492735 RepID=A0A917S0C2_9BACL|nr:hypothetical protein GCM10007968_11030 [Sporolactobacillus putidus]